MYQKYTIHTTSNTTIYHNHHYQFHEYVLPLICSPPSVLWPGPNGIENFQTRDFRDRILQNPGIPGFFRTGLAWNFIPGFYQKVRDISGFPSQRINLVNFINFVTYLFVNYIRQTKVSSIPSCGKQQERASVQCCWQGGDPEMSLPRTRESRSLRFCQIQPWSVKRHGLLK